MVGIDILAGYFDLDRGLELYVNGSKYLPVFSCRECFAIVLGRHVNQHVDWHLNRKIPDKQKSPDDIQAEARRELGDIKRVQIQMERDHYSLQRKYNE